MKRRGAGRVALIVLDGVGIGAAPDAAAFGDEGSDTLGNVARAVGGLDLPNLARLGLGCCRPLEGVVCADPQAAHGVALPRSPGKDSTTGHWELCGLVLERAFPTFPDGFPSDVIQEFAERTGRPVVGNRTASGTAIIDELGPEQLDRGAWIVYTSADSVFQIAAHEGAIPLHELYRACELARRDVLTGPLAVSRVIARPFEGAPGRFVRTANRRDFSLEPPGDTLLDRLVAAGVPRAGIGKVDDLFAGRGIKAVHTATNAACYARIAEALATLDRGLIFVNVPEFDQTWGHRNDVPGFYQGLKDLDAVLPSLIALLRPDDLMILTADHGNDPTTASTDHSREAVPVVVLGPGVRPVPLGERGTFADVGASAAEYFGIGLEWGTSFLEQVASWRS
ncbi:MAG: phosphopentomutase [Gemmatimonadales bacterium]|nr:phosphopentomutase [Gemmatimonadales bacterium]